MMALICTKLPLQTKLGICFFPRNTALPSIRGLGKLSRQPLPHSAKTRAQSEHRNLIRSIDNGNTKQIRHSLECTMLNLSDNAKRQLLTDAVVNMVHRGHNMSCVSIVNEFAESHRLLPSISSLQLLVERSDIGTAKLLVNLSTKCPGTTHSFVQSTILRKLLDWKCIGLGWDVFQKLKSEIGTQRQYSRFIKEFSNMSDRSLSLDYLQKLLVEGFTPSTTNYNILMNSAHCQQQFSTVVELFDRMIAEGHSPTTYTYSILVNALLAHNEIEKAEAFIQTAVANGQYLDAYVCTDYLKVLRQMKGPREVLRHAAQIFDLSRLGLPLANSTSSNTFNNLLPLTAVSASLILHQALKIVVSPKKIWALYCSFMKETDLMTPHLHTIFLGALASNSESNNLPQRILQHMVESACDPDEVTYGYFINQLAEHGRLEEAEAVWVSMVARGVLPNVRIYTALMKGYVKQKQYAIARQKFAEMLNSGLKPNSHTFAVISKCI